MRFQVPQFIERETKILGPLSFRQFIFVGIAGTIIFVLYFALAKTNFLAFVSITVLLVIGSLALAFIRIGGKSLSETMGNVIIFFASSKIYLWKKKGIAPRLIKIDKGPKEEKEADEPVLKMRGKGRLEKLSIHIETRTK